MSSKSELENLNKRWEKDCTCDLRKEAKQAVFGNGSPTSDIVFIGEAPGKKEDEQGVPFIGSAGKFLDGMLNEINLKREDIYITNIVKYRPPNNRDPLPEEKASCRDWLLEELKIIKPKLIVFLGRHAMNNFFPTEQISSVHGKLLVKKFNGISTKYFYALYHPAAALYNGGMRATLMEDFKKIPKILKEISTKEQS